MSIIVASILLAASGTTDAPAPQQKEKVICKTLPTTGTRLARDRICMTKSQWRAHQDGTERDVDSMRGPPLPDRGE